MNSDPNDDPSPKKKEVGKNQSEENRAPRWVRLRAEIRWIGAEIEFERRMRKLVFFLGSVVSLALTCLATVFALKGHVGPASTCGAGVTAIFSGTMVYLKFSSSRLRDLIQENKPKELPKSKGKTDELSP